MARTDDLNRILRELQSRTPGVEGCALVSEDGLVVSSALPQHVDDARAAATASMLLELGVRAAADLERGGLEQALVRGEAGYALMVKAPRGALLLVLAARAARLGLLFLEVGRAVEQLERAL